MTSTAGTHGQIDAREALRAAAHRTATKAQEAHEALTGLEHDVRAREDSICAHRAAIATHKQQLADDKNSRAALHDAVAQARKHAAQTGKHASKAEARYDKAVLAQLVIDAKNADEPAPARKTAARKATPAKTAASTTAPARKTGPRKAAPARTVAPAQPK